MVSDAGSMDADPTSPESKAAYRRVVAVLFQLSKQVSAGGPLATLLKQIANAAAELVGGDRCSIMLLDDSGRYLLSKASHGLTADEEKVSFRVGEGIAGWVAEHGEPACVPDVTADRRFRRLPNTHRAIASMLCVPLLIRGEVLGTMCVSSSRPGAFGSDQQDLLMYLGSSVVKDIENARLYQLAITDPLTKAYNRQYLYQRLPNEIERARRYADPLSVIAFDVDHFKKLNDGFGHDAGDMVLRKLVDLTRATCREVDDLVRFGGEEFVVLLPKTDLVGAGELAERLRVAVEGGEFAWSGQHLSVTVSLGVTALGQTADTDGHLLKRADELLYQAKAAGRNCVVVDATPGGMPGAPGDVRRAGERPRAG